MTEPATPAASRPRVRRRLLLVATAVVMAVGGVTAATLIPRLLRHHVTLVTPTAVAGLVPATDPASSATVRALAQSFRDHGADNVVSGVFGSDAAAPTVIFAAGTGANAGNREDVFRLSPPRGLELDERSTESVSGSVTFACRALRHSEDHTPAAVLCAWTEGDAASLMIDLQDTSIAPAAALAVQVRQATTG